MVDDDVHLDMGAMAAFDIEDDAKNNRKSVTERLHEDQARKRSSKFMKMSQQKGGDGDEAMGNFGRRNSGQGQVANVNDAGQMPKSRASNIMGAMMMDDNEDGDITGQAHAHQR